MNNYKYNEIKVGMSFNFKSIITNEKMDSFLMISGDNNPLHCDSAYAKANGMQDRVVYGLLSSSFYSTLVGVYIPGKYAILHSVDIQFSKPVYIGDQLTVVGEVVRKHDLFNQIEIKAYIQNQNNERVSRAKIKAGLING
jgi:3-hydroxybutyryl-CoA dehydratase